MYLSGHDTKAGLALGTRQKCGYFTSVLKNVLLFLLVTLCGKDRRNVVYYKVVIFPYSPALLTETIPF